MRGALAAQATSDPDDATKNHARRRVVAAGLVGTALLLAAAEPAVAAPESAVAAPAKHLRVDARGRCLERADGRPFFYLGDTAWELFGRLDLDAAGHYLSDRAAKGFSVIQAVVVMDDDGRDLASPAGDPPFRDRATATLDEAYLRHVDAVVARAGELGLVTGLLPTWGSYWKQVGRPGAPVLGEDNARALGRVLGRRYREASVIWILGGDQSIESEAERRVVDALASGLREGDGGAHLMTYHPRGPGLSSAALHAAPWLDFNMFQSSHGARDHDNGLFAAHDYALQPPKPTLDGEPRYETVPVGFYFGEHDRLVRFDDADVRQAAYWSLLAGACGHAYGHNSVWQMWQPGRPPKILANVPWREALDAPGAFQMGHVRRLFESRPYERLVPDDGRLVKDAPRAGGAKVRAALAADGSFAVVYSPRGERFTLDKSRIADRRVRELWYDPRYGVAYHFHTTDNQGFQTYTPPSSGRGADWLLILESGAARFPLPQESARR
jgi:hypothetical protein